MIMAKSLCPIAAEEVILKFDDTCIVRLAGIGKLPAHANKQRFAEGIRVAARIYARDVREPNDNYLHIEIAMLHKAAESHDYELVANLLAALSPRSREQLNDRGKRPGFGFGLPTPQGLREPELREEACISVARLCRTGGGYVGGRLRRPGKRSRTWRWRLYAPEPRSYFPKRQAERDFVTFVRLAWLEAVGEAPSATVNPGRGKLRPNGSREPGGPFARMVCECLRLVGASHADTVGLLNELARRRRLSRRDS
jgi:hypothetical protein